MAADTALLALHFQNDVLHPDGRVALGLARDPAARGSLLAAAGRLLAGARAAGLPVISAAIEFSPDPAFVPVNAPIFRAVAENGAMRAGSWGADFFAGLGPLPGEPVLRHDRVNAFYESPLSDMLDELAITRLVIAGIATNSTVEHSARHAADMGYRVTIAADACGCAAPHLHRASLENLAFVADIATVDSILAEWTQAS